MFQNPFYHWTKWNSTNFAREAEKEFHNLNDSAFASLSLSPTPTKVGGSLSQNRSTVCKVTRENNSPVRIKLPNTIQFMSMPLLHSRCAPESKTGSPFLAARIPRTGAKSPLPSRWLPSTECHSRRNTHVAHDVRTATPTPSSCHPNRRDAQMPAPPVAQHSTHATCALTVPARAPQQGEAPPLTATPDCPPSHPNGRHSPQPNALPVALRGTHTMCALATPNVHSPFPSEVTAQRAARCSPPHGCDDRTREKRPPPYNPNFRHPGDGAPAAIPIPMDATTQLPTRPPSPSTAHARYVHP
ncbi:hypothetical protein HD554DRAFT_589778 [Boletus coccyginus]|nr:hypothetical protein HD554DRAFT_589778 [Boletus coccyginus]